VQARAARLDRGPDAQFAPSQRHPKPCVTPDSGSRSADSEGRWRAPRPPQAYGHEQRRGDSGPSADAVGESKLRGRILLPVAPIHDAPGKRTPRRRSACAGGRSDESRRNGSLAGPARRTTVTDAPRRAAVRGRSRRSGADGPRSRYRRSSGASAGEGSRAAGLLGARRPRSSYPSREGSRRRRPTCSPAPARASRTKAAGGPR